MRQLELILISLLCCWHVAAQGQAQIHADELTYNFGTIAEADGPASHTFTISNPGDAPLVITRVTASCGCTQPEWTKSPIGPGKTGVIKVTYNPAGRPGPFYKTISIFSNGKKGSYSLAIKGNVTPKPAEPLFVYPYSFGDLKLHTKTVLYSSIHEDETLGERIQVKNEGETTCSLTLGKVPHYYTIEARPTRLAPGETGEIYVLLDAKAVKRKGRVTTELPIKVQFVGQEEINGTLHLAANIIDNFSKMTVAEKSQAPSAYLSGTLLEFGKLPKKSGGFMIKGGKVTGTFELTNKGKKTLTIYSVSSDDERLDISGGKKELKPGATAIFKVSIRPKEIKTKLEALINVVCNDPNGPGRLIKVTAQK